MNYKFTIFFFTKLLFILVSFEHFIEHLVCCNEGVSRAGLVRAFCRTCLVRVHCNESVGNGDRREVEAVLGKEGIELAAY